MFRGSLDWQGVKDRKQSGAKYGEKKQKAKEYWAYAQAIETGGAVLRGPQTQRSDPKPSNCAGHAEQHLLSLSLGHRPSIT